MRKTVRLAPMPRASVSTVAKVNPALLRNCRSAYTTSCLRKPVVITQILLRLAKISVQLSGRLKPACKLLAVDDCRGVRAIRSVRFRTWMFDSAHVSLSGGHETDSLFRCFLYRLPGIQQGKIGPRCPHRRQVAVVLTVWIARFSRVVHGARIVP